MAGRNKDSILEQVKSLFTFPTTVEINRGGSDQQRLSFGQTARPLHCPRSFPKKHNFNLVISARPAPNIHVVRYFLSTSCITQVLDLEILTGGAHRASGANIE